MNNFSFSHSVFKRLVSQGRQKVSLCGNGLTFPTKCNFEIFHTEGNFQTLKFNVASNKGNLYLKRWEKNCEKKRKCFWPTFPTFPTLLELINWPKLSWNYHQSHEIISLYGIRTINEFLPFGPRKHCLATHGKQLHLYINPLPDDKILDWSKLKKMQMTF